MRFAFPKGERYGKVRTLFEARAIEPGEDGFADEFAEPRDVHVYELRRGR